MHLRRNLSRTSWLSWYLYVLRDRLDGPQHELRFSEGSRGTIPRVKRFHLVLPALVLALASCARAQSFSEVAGNLRVSGQVESDPISPQRSRLSLNLANAQTGHPLDATDVELKAGGAQPIHAMRAQTGSYTANFTNADRVEVLILTRDRAAVIALQQH